MYMYTSNFQIPPAPATILHLAPIFVSPGDYRIWVSTVYIHVHAHCNYVIFLSRRARQKSEEMKRKPIASFFSAIPQIILPQNHYLETLEIKQICK